MAAQDAAGARKIARCAPAQRGVIAMELDLDGVADLDMESAAELRGQRDRMTSRHLSEQPLAALVAFGWDRHRIPLPAPFGAKSRSSMKSILVGLRTTRCLARIVAR